MAKAGICFIGLPVYVSRIDLLECIGIPHKNLAGISSDCHLDKWSLHNRPLMAENLRKMAKSPQGVKIVSVKRG